ncbi:penicillin-binding transpeptidase domain-containing protein [Spongiactinospora sp. TRM90649]|uniref:penicillin-binding transpeptidase domain-containing protein n=1 Tax=Spongiactinospora sp. TRM90649 TaxID=3031114 RepID=UPI0023F8B875|nr:penicillin-binding transpeptidase domain-containing protein [Spongiactinospora sp. TRM90649]MDF5753287.1 penicillin-binding transpeptidase domain-containing protein [Spongiactinospora sp. TRM90649]
MAGRMDVPLRRVVVGCAVLMFALLVQVSHLQTFGADALRRDLRNLRTQIERFDQPRGELLARGGGVLATSVRERGRFGYRRVYPGGAVYAPVTGHLSLFAATGMEGARDAVLSGADPRVHVRALLGDLGHAAASIRLTVDERAQRAAYQALRDTGRRGAVVALDPATGAILALVSFPSYDPNRLATHDPQALSRVESALLADDASPLMNRALNRSYPVGPALGIISQAARLTGGALWRQAMGFGFNSGGLYIPLWVSPSVFPGKGARATPLEIAMLSAAVANGGVLMRPHLVREIRMHDGTVLEETTPMLYRWAMPAKVARAVARTMTRKAKRGGPGTAAVELPGEPAVATGFAPSGKPYVAVGVTLEPEREQDTARARRDRDDAASVINAVLGAMTKD